MKRKIKIIVMMLVPMVWLSVNSCSDSFLDQPVMGVLSPDQVSSQNGVEELLIGAYSALKGSRVQASNGEYSHSNTNWVFGGLVGYDAFKGSNSGDQSAINQLTSFEPTSNNGYLDDQWVSVYDGVNRANTVLRALATVEDGEISADDIKRITGEARFLRGFYHLEAKMMWNMVPYIDETVTYKDNNYFVANDRDIWPDIMGDFQFAMDNLPEGGLAPGRANKWAAAAFYAKCLMYQQKFSEALPVLRDIIDNGVTAQGTKYGLNPKFRDSFDAATDNSRESVFAIQASVNDGSTAQNANADLVLNYPYLSSLPVNCCGFNQPTYDLANSYRTNAAGLPLLDASYNSQPLTDEEWVRNADATDVPADMGNLDPRIDWTLGRTGVPFLDWGNYTGPPWVRSLPDGGPYTVKKFTFPTTELGNYTDNSSWTAGYSAVNYNLIRFADVLLWAAEAEVEAGSLSQAKDYVNMVRSRAMDPGTWVRVSKDPTKSDWDAYLDPSIPSEPAGNYVIGLYGQGGDNTFADQSTARMAVHFERKLELGMEGHRFFDLVRWGETTGDNTNGNPVNLQQAIDYCGEINNLAKGVKFKKGINEYYPIPLNQITYSNGSLKQLDGYN